MIRILKYDVPGTCKGKIRQVLNVKLQYGKPKVWVMMDDTLEEERTLEFFTVGTGWALKGQDEEIMKQALYVGTVKDEEGYIWHVFCLPVKDDENKEEVFEEVAAEPVSEDEASK